MLRSVSRDRVCRAFASNRSGPGCSHFDRRRHWQIDGRAQRRCGRSALRLLIPEMGHASHCSAGDNVVVDFAFQTEPAALVQVFVDGFTHPHLEEIPSHPHLAVKGCAEGQA